MQTTDVKSPVESACSMQSSLAGSSGSAAGSGCRSRLPGRMQGRRSIVLLGASALLAGGAALGWPWLVAMGAAPILLSVAPCAVMCALGLCMMHKGMDSAAVLNAAADERRRGARAGWRSRRSSLVTRVSKSLKEKIEMSAKPYRVLAVAVVAIGLASASIALAAAKDAGAPAQTPPGTAGQGMMNGGAMMGNDGGMMSVMSAMTRMANLCNRMMKTALDVPGSPAKQAPHQSHG